VDLYERFLAQAKESGVVILAGAGVSAIPPSCLPDWVSLNKMIVGALCERIETYLNRPAYTRQLQQRVNARLNETSFPPDYQAQILKENCGDPYFKALQSLDISTTNPVHEIIGWLARQGFINAIVTTNFDCLLEKALDKQGVLYEVAYEPSTYKRCLGWLKTRTSTTPLPVLKVHGSVKDHSSMVDTLKQRLLKRNKNLDKCLEILLSKYFWLVTGFSARDLETDCNYLRFLPCAGMSPGLIYVQWPGEKELSAGAKVLLECYSRKSLLKREELEPFLLSICRSLKLPEFSTENKSGKSNTLAQVEDNLRKWAGELHPAAVVNCLASIIEANCATSEAFRLLHRFWKDVYPEDRKGADFEFYRFNHGRLGMGYGQLSLAEDLQNTAGEESLQNLLRIHEKDPRALAWVGLTFLWAGSIESAMSFLEKAKKALTEMALSSETQIDIWLALQEERYLLLMPETVEEIQDFVKEWSFIEKLAEKAGDLPRQAKSTVLASLVLAEHPNFYEVFVQENAQQILSRVERLNDPNINGFKCLAEGRFQTIQRNGRAARIALQKATNDLISAGRLPWAIFAQIELIKAYLDEAKQVTNADYNALLIKLKGMVAQLNDLIDRYQIFLPWFEEVIGQICHCYNDGKKAREAFERAIAYAHRLGLKSKETLLKKYLV
jgi:hypothetical protein